MVSNAEKKIVCIVYICISIVFFIYISPSIVDICFQVVNIVYLCPCNLIFFGTQDQQVPCGGSGLQIHGNWDPFIQDPLVFLVSSLTFSRPRTKSLCKHSLYCKADSPGFYIIFLATKTLIARLVGIWNYFFSGQACEIPIW